MKIYPMQLDMRCTDCPACQHQFPPSDAPVKGNCGDEQYQGGCFGIIIFAVKNPDLTFRGQVKAGMDRVAA